MLTRLLGLLPIGYLRPDKNPGEISSNWYAADGPKNEH